MNDELDALFPARELTVNSETLTIAPFFFGQLPKAVKLMRPLAEALQSTNVVSVDAEGGVSLASDWPLKIPAIVADGGDALLDLLAFVVKKPRDWFDTLGVDDGVTLTRAAFEVNRDFFVKKIVPLLPVAIKAQDAATSGEPSPPA